MKPHVLKIHVVKAMIISVIAVLIVGALSLRRSVVPVVEDVAAQSGPTAGYTQYSSTYNVQNRTDAPLSERFSITNGVFQTTVFAGEERVEMRWANWPNQNTYNQFECDARFDGGTQRTAIHQIKSNTGGEPIYIQVTTPGTIRNDGGTPFASGLANTWFHVNSLFNPTNGDSRLYINGSLKVTRQYSTSSRDWYFKNGVYNNGIPPGGRSRAWFKNIRHWRR